MSKIAVIGVGHVGSICALHLAQESICNDLVLIDCDKEKAKSQAADLKDAASVYNNRINIYAGNYTDIADADIAIISVGVPRKPGQTRLELLDVTVDLIEDVIENIKICGFTGIIVSISNPCDIIANYIRMKLDYPKNKIFGTGTLLDTVRLRRTLSEELNVAPRSIQCFAMGEHGDSSMIAFSQIRIGTMPLMQIIENESGNYPNLSFKYFLDRTHQISMEIIEGKNSTEFGIGACTSLLCRSILRDERNIFPVSAYLEGEYDENGICAGVPCVIGKNGIEQIIPLNLTTEEKDLFKKSCDIISQYNKLAQQH